MQKLRLNRLNRRRDLCSRWAWLPLVALLAGSCANEPKRTSWEGAERLTQPPLFFTGPAAVLLAHPGGYMAHLTIVFAPDTHPRSVAGQLVARDARFFFTPAPLSEGPVRAGQFSFIWDAISNTGYILSEALQGYAPIHSAAGFTKLPVEGSPITLERVEGHPVTRATSVVEDGNGKPSRLDVSRARDLDEVAIRIGSLEASQPYTITLSQVRLERPSEKIFLPPEGFTAYANEEAMLNELSARQGDLRSKGGARFEGAGQREDNGRSHRSRTGVENEP